jgi:hypothetical protein
MPHSVTPESTPAEESSATPSQADAVKPEPETQDVAMEDAPAPAAAEKPKVSLEELFDDEDSDGEFASSAPAPTSQEDASQPAPMYAPTYWSITSMTLADINTARSHPNPPSPIQTLCVPSTSAYSPSALSFNG